MNFEGNIFFEKNALMKKYFETNSFSIVSRQLSSMRFFTRPSSCRDVSRVLRGGTKRIPSETRIYTGMKKLYTDHF